MRQEASKTRRAASRIATAVKAVVGPVIQEWPLWLTIVFTLIPLTWGNLEYHVRTLHDFPPVILWWACGNMGVVAVAATIVVWIVGQLPHRRAVKWLLYTLLLALWLVSLFLLRNFNTSFSPQILQLLVETNRGESTEFLQAWIGAPGTVRAILIAVMTLLLVLLAEWKRQAVASRLSRRVPMAIVTLLLVALLVRGLGLWRKLVHPYKSLYELELYQTRYFSTDVISTLHTSLTTLKLQRHETGAAVDLNVKTALAAPGVTSAADTMDLVLVIGESYNKRRSSLYGYQLDTSPLMRAERDKGLLTVFTDAISPYNLTSVSIKNMLSLNSLSRGQQWHQYPIWPAVMHRAGWQVDLWDNQRSYGPSEIHSVSLMSFLFAPDMVKHVYHHVNDEAFDHDGELIEDYYRKSAPTGRNLVIFHLMGQHSNYELRYPHTADWEVWTTADLPAAAAPYMDESRRQVMLHYARATRYNDHVLASILDHYRDRNAVVVMLSDHGEEVYDYRDFIVRDHDPNKTALMVRYENDIPLLVWCSPVYKSRHPGRAAAIAAASSRRFMSDSLGQLMLWLGQVTSPWNDSTLNVVSPAYSPGRRLIYDGIDYDRLMGR